MPSTISGVDIGRKINRLVDAATAEEWRTRARPIRTPRIVETIVARNAMIEAVEDRVREPGPAQRVEPRVEREAAPA